MTIGSPNLENELMASKTSRLRLMTLLSLYDMLPHSISRPPTGQEPIDLDDAIDPEAVKRVLALVQASEEDTSHANGNNGSSTSQQIPNVTRSTSIANVHEDGSRTQNPADEPSLSRNSHEGGIDRARGRS